MYWKPDLTTIARLRLSAIGFLLFALLPQEKQTCVRGGKGVGGKAIGYTYPQFSITRL